MISTLDISSKAATTHKFYCVDLMKFIGSLLVVAVHLSPLEDVNSWANYILVECIARVAVPFYFVSSGYFLFRKVCLDPIETSSVYTYLKRILRLYGIWTIVYLPIVVKDLLQNGGGLDDILVLFRIIFVWGYHHLWYLHATIVAILIVLFCLKRKISLQKILLMGSILYVLGLLAQSWFGLIEPLRNVSFIWKSFKIGEWFIRTTKNGFFFGVLMIGIGIWFSKKKITIRFRTAVIGFWGSLFFLAIESIFVDFFSLARNHDMYIFLVPTVFFMFYVITHIELKEKDVYGRLREIGFIVYLVHIWVDRIVLRYIGEPMHSLVRYIVVLGISILVAQVIVFLRRKVGIWHSHFVKRKEKSV